MTDVHTCPTCGVDLIVTLVLVTYRELLQFLGHMIRSTSVRFPPHRRWWQNQHTSCWAQSLLQTRTNNLLPHGLLSCIVDIWACRWSRPDSCCCLQSFGVAGCHVHDHILLHAMSSSTASSLVSHASVRHVVRVLGISPMDEFHALLEAEKMRIGLSNGDCVGPGDEG